MFFKYTSFEPISISRLSKEDKRHLLLENLKVMQLITMAESFKNSMGALRPFLPLFTYNILSIEFTFSLITRLCDLNLTCLERILLLTICLFNTSSVYHSVSTIQENLKDMLQKQLSENDQWKWNELTVLLTILQSVGLQIFKSSSQQSVCQ